MTKKLIKSENEIQEQKRKETVARKTNSPAIASIAAAEPYATTTYGEFDFMASYNELNLSIKAVQDGNLQELEAMLVGQAKALQIMFTNLARRAHAQEHLKQYTVHMNMALKTQAQSRATIQALVELKYPRQVVVTKQANFSQGHQQVNNGMAPQVNVPATPNKTPHAQEKNQNEQNNEMDSSHLQTASQCAKL